MDWLPDSLPAKFAPLWQAELPSGGVGGLAANSEFLVVGSRDIADSADVFESYRAKDGTLAWVVAAPDTGSLDYGNSPRATPLLSDGFVVTVGAFGTVQLIDLETGARIWKTHLVRDLSGKMPDWGYSASPILIGEELLVQPGGRENSLVALDFVTGEVLWKSAGEPAAYASLVLNNRVKPPQLLGMDQQGVCGWTLEGKLLWKRQPQVRGDFGVPTPIASEFGLVLISENNGLRLYPFDPNGIPTEDPISTLPNASPNSHTPVVVGNRLLVAHNGLECFDLNDGLNSLWKVKDRAMRGFASVIASEDRVLMLTQNGTLFLMDLATGKELGRLSLCDPSIRVLSAPALVGDRLYIRIDKNLFCLQLQ